MQESQLATILLLLVPVPISIYLLAYIARRRAPVDLPLGLIIFTGGIWSCGYAMELYFDSFEAKVLAERFEYLGLVIGPTGWLLLGVYFQDRLASVSRAGYLLLSLVPVLTLVLVFTSDFHGLFWQSKSLVEFGGFTLFNNQYGFGFWLHAVYSYTIQLVGAGLIFKTMLDSDAYYYRQKLMVSVAVMLPWVTSLIYVFRITDLPIDFSPFALVFSSVLLVLVVFRFKLGELIPIARERVMSEMRDAILVVDDRLRIVDFNHAFVELCGSQSVKVGQKADELLEAHPRLVSFLVKQEKSEDLVYTGFGTSVHRVSSEMIETGRDAYAKLVIFRNLSGESRIQEALRLVVEGTSGDLGEDYYRSLVRSLALALNVKYAVLAIRDDNERELFTTVAFWAGADYGENLTYQFKGAPSERVIEEGTSVFPNSVAQLFPADSTLIKYNIESYIGTPLYGYDGIPLGVLAIMDESPLDSGAEGSALLEFFAMRAAAEVERRQGERNIRASEESYRRIVETTKDGVCVVNRDGIVEFVNQPMASLIGE